MDTFEIEVGYAEQQRYDELLAMAIEYARLGDVGSLRAMLEVGLPVNLKDEKGNTMLMLAAYHDHADLVRLLLDFGADIEMKNDRNQRPLGGVAFKGHFDVAQLLIERGADVNGDNGGKMPLLFALMFGRLKVARLLRSHGARIRLPKEKRLV